MSIKIMADIWEMDLTPTKKLVLLALADHADHDGCNVYPSLQLIAAKTNITKRAVQRNVSALRSDGVLKVVRESCRHRPTEYRIDLSVLQRQKYFEDRQYGSDCECSNDDFRGDTSVVPKESRGDTSVTLGVTPASPKPSENHHKESEPSNSSSSCEDTSVYEDRPVSAPPPDDDDGDDSEIPFVYDFSENQNDDREKMRDDMLVYVFKLTGLDPPGIKKIRRENPNLRPSAALAVYREWQNDNAAGRNLGKGILVNRLIDAGESHPGIEQAQDELYDVFYEPLRDTSNGRPPAPPPETTIPQDVDRAIATANSISAFHEKYRDPSITVN